MKSSSSQKHRPTKKSQSYQRIGIDYLLSSSDRSQHKSMIYDNIGTKIYDQSQSKKNKFLIQLPKIYPIHKKLMNMKMKDLQYHKNQYNNYDRRFHLRGFRFLLDVEQSEDTTIETQELKKSRLQMKKKQTLTTVMSMTNHNGNSLWNQLILKINHINQFHPIKNTKLKAFVQEGNNSRLIKELLRKRPQIKLVQSRAQADILWTRFSDYAAVQKCSRYSIQKGQKSSNGSSLLMSNNNSSSSNYNCSRTEEDYVEGLRKLTQLQPQKILSSSQTTSKSITISSFFMHNHLKNHQQLSDKKNLFRNIRTYCKVNGINQSEIIPKTFHIDCGKMKEDRELEQSVGEIFVDGKFTQSSFFVVKPGEDTNRGEGITIVRGKQNIINAVKQLQKKGKSSLIQQYINPLLYKNRKFDIRCYVLVTSITGQLHAYWYKQGYLRTCVKQFNYDPSNIYGHLTNDAIQKKHKDYGKYEQANKLSFGELENIVGQTQKIRDDVIQEMKVLARHSIRAVENSLRGEKSVLGFEIFGYDFLLDSQGKVWLIQVNTNPCLEFSGSLLSRIIWHMVDNSIRIAIDPYLDGEGKKDYHQNSIIDLNKYELIV